VSTRTVILSVLALVVALGLFQSAYTVDQTERAIVLQLGKPLPGVREPGLHFKLPFIQNVAFFDSRLLEYDSPPAEVLTKDKKTLVLDNYSRWRIVDPLAFYRTVRTIPRAQARLDDIIYSQMRVALGRYDLIEVVATERQEIMAEVTAKSNEPVAEFGIEIIDVRIKRTDLPPENEKAIFNRMRAERERQAKQYRSEGREAAARITAATDKDKTILLAEAQKTAETLRGQGDAEATRIYAQALGQDPDFYAFLRSLEAYRTGLKDNTRLILTPDSPFFQYFK
jgi:membrane protease subunit HflC